MSERLDRIEANVERISEQLAALADNQIALHNDVEAIATSQTALHREVEAMTQTVQQNSVTCTQLTQEMHSNVAELVSMMGYVAETGEENRQEIRRIWEYLLGQSGNGNGRNNQE